jgi:hypothetical protein
VLVHALVLALVLTRAKVVQQAPFAASKQAQA